MKYWLPQTVSIFFLVLALNPHNPYGYYVFLRWLCFAAFTYLAYGAFELGKTSWCAIFVITAITYNPLIRVHLPREMWLLLNLAAIAVAVASIFSMRKEKAYVSIFTRNDSSERTRNVLAWTVGIASMVVMVGIGFSVLQFFGVQTEFENEDEMAPALAAIIIVCIMLASRIGMAVYTGKLDGGVSEAGRLDFKAWILGISTWGFFGAVLYALIAGEGFFSYALKYSLLVAAGVVIGLVCWGWRDRQKALMGLSGDFTLNWRMGARVSAIISTAAANISSKIEVQHGGLKVDAKKAMALMLLIPDSPPKNDDSPGLPAGSDIRLTITGPDAAAAMEALTKIFRRPDPYF